MDHAGFMEVEHTADWELQVWAPDLPGLFQQAAQGMYTLSGTQLQPGQSIVRELTLQAGDWESLLVSFLSELLYLGEEEGLGFETYAIQVQGNTAVAQLRGAKIASQEKEIKAVTYHQLKIRSSESGLTVNIVFDV